jgi:Spy/CpxP family protein refolding chaperone
MWQKIKPLLWVLSITLNLAFLAGWAAQQVQASVQQKHAKAMMESGACKDCPLNRQLGANQQQCARMAPLQTALQDSTRCLCRRLQQARAELVNLIAVQNPDRQAIRDKQAEIYQNQRAMQDLVVDHLLTEKSLLSPQQQEKLFDLLRERTGCVSGRMCGSTGMMCGADLSIESNSQ